MVSVRLLAVGDEAHFAQTPCGMRAVEVLRFAKPHGDIQSLGRAAAAPALADEGDELAAFASAFDLRPVFDRLSRSRARQWT